MPLHASPYALLLPLLLDPTHASAMMPRHMAIEPIIVPTYDAYATELSI